MTEKQHLDRIPLDRLIPYARNSRTHSDAQVAQIAASIREFGFANPVLIDAQDGIIAGHGGVLAVHGQAHADGWLSRQRFPQGAFWAAEAGHEVGVRRG